MTEIETQVQSFDRSKLKTVQTEVKNPLPSASTLHEELRPDNYSMPDVTAVAKFDQANLKPVETKEKNILPCADTIKQESIESRSEVKNFDFSKLKPVRTEEKNPLPSASTLHEELRPDSYSGLPDVSAVAKFDQSKLRSVETKEKIVLPCADTIQQESIESRSEVKAFDLKRLRPVRTQVKNPLPTPGMLRLEMRPVTLPDMSEVVMFDRTDLRKTITKEICFLPSLDAIKEEAFESRAEIKTFDRTRLRSVPSVS